MTKKLYTPWGYADSVSEVVPGILSVTTPGHGGYKLDRKRNAAVHSAWRRKGGWYEEDNEWAIVVFTFKGEFPAESVEQAVYKVKSHYPHQYQEVTGERVSLEESYVLRKEKALADAAGKLQSYSAFGSWHHAVPKGKVGLVAKINGRDGEGPERYFLIDEKDYVNYHPVFVVDPTKAEEVSAFLP
jgi:hypothetical protein